MSLSASTADAATVERVQRTDPFGSPYDSYFLEYAAAPGEANNLEIRLDPDGVTLHDAGAGRSRPRAATRSIPRPRDACYGDRLTVTLGDGDDVARVVALDPRRPPDEAGPAVLIEAGAGADSITGGPGDEVFTDGGDGEADRFAGGGGSDLVSYDGRRTPVRVTVGAPGEDVLDGIETVEGGDGDDVLIGDAGPNVLWGGPGDDTVRGLGGRDDLDGDAGSDRLYGGAGDDALSGDSYASGLGRDLLEGGRGDDYLDLGAADDGVLSIGGPESEDAVDGRRDTARGGPGFDAFATATTPDRPQLRGRGLSATSSASGAALRRVSRRTLRLRVGSTPRVLDRRRIVLSPRGKQRPRLTKPLDRRRRHDHAAPDPGRFALPAPPAPPPSPRRTSTDGRRARVAAPRRLSLRILIVTRGRLRSRTRPARRTAARRSPRRCARAAARRTRRGRRRSSPPTRRGRACRR